MSRIDTGRRRAAHPGPAEGLGLAGVAARIRACSPPEIGGRPVRAVGSCSPDAAGVVVGWGLVARPTAPR